MNRQESRKETATSTARAKETLRVPPPPKSIVMIRNQLLSLSKEYPHQFTLLDFCPENTSEDLHAKTIVFDRTTAYVGSLT